MIRKENNGLGYLHFNMRIRQILKFHKLEFYAYNNIVHQTSERPYINHLVDQDRKYFRMPFLFFISNLSLEGRTARL